MKKLTQKSKLLIGYAISGFGDQFYTFAIPLLMLSRIHSSIIMGLLTAVEYLPTALFGLTIGPIFDMYSRKKNHAFFSNYANGANYNGTIFSYKKHLNILAAIGCFLTW